MAWSWPCISGLYQSLDDIIVYIYGPVITFDILYQLDVALALGELVGGKGTKGSVCVAFAVPLVA